MHAIMGGCEVGGGRTLLGLGTRDYTPHKTPFQNGVLPMQYQHKSRWKRLIIVSFLQTLSIFITSDIGSLTQVWAHWPVGFGHLLVYMHFFSLLMNYYLWFHPELKLHNDQRRPGGKGGEGESRGLAPPQAVAPPYPHLHSRLKQS